MKIINGGLAVDGRGKVIFCNDFDFKDVKRFYMVENHSKGFIRAWHAHKKEGKYVFVTKGTILLRHFEVDNWQSPGKRAIIHHHTLSSDKPQIIYVPSGHANGFKTLTDDAQVMFFSTTTMSESEGDDYRFPVDLNNWKVFEVEER